MVYLNIRVMIPHAFHLNRYYVRRWHDNCKTLVSDNCRHPNILTMDGLCVDSLIDLRPQNIKFRCFHVEFRNVREIHWETSETPKSLLAAGGSV